jgi:hypothetical protein
MSERRTVKTVLQYEVDKASVKQAADSADQVENAVNGIGDEFQRLGPVAKAAATGVRLGFASMKKDAQTLENQLERVEDQFEDIGRAARRAGSAGPGGFRASTESAGDLGSLLSATAGLESLGGGAGARILGEAGQLGDVVEALGRLPSAVDDVSEAIGVGKAGLVGGLGLVAVATIGLTFLFADIAKTQAEAAQRAQEYRDSIAEIGDILASGRGSEGINELLSGARDKQASLEFQREFAQGLVDQVNAAIPDAEGDPINLIQRRQFLSDLTGGQLTSIEALQTSITDLGTQSEQAGAEVYLLEQQLASTTVQAQDAAAAERQRQQDVVASIQRTSSAMAEAERFAQTATLVSVAERIRAYEDEVSHLEATNAALALQNNEAANAAIAHNDALIDEKQAAIDATLAIRGSVAAREFEAGVLNRFLGAGQDAFGGIATSFAGGLENIVDGVASAASKIGSVQTSIEQANRDSAVKFSEIARQRTDAETKALTERDRSLEDAARERTTSLEDLEREHKARLLEINRRANATIANSIGERDALAAFLAQSARREEVREENRNNKEALRKIDAAFKEQQRVIQRRYDEQLAAAKSAAERATEIERARLQVQVDALNQQLVNQQTAAGLELQVRNETNNAVLNGLISLRDQALALFGGTGTQTQSGYDIYQQTIDAQRAITGGGRAYGGAVNSGQRVLVGEHGPEIAYFRSPAMVMSNRASRSGAGNTMTFNIDMTGVSDSQFVSKATRVFHTELNKVYHAAKQKRGLA